MSISSLPPEQTPTDDPSHLPVHASDASGDNWGSAIARIAFLLLTIALLIGVFVLVRNFLHAIILGVLGATMLSPVYQRVLLLVHLITRRLRRRRLIKRKKLPSLWLRNPRAYTRRWRRTQSRVASLLTVAGVFCVIVIPISFFSITVVKQGRRTLVSSLRWIQSGEMESKLHAVSQKYDLQNKWEKLVELTQVRWQNTNEEMTEITTVTDDEDSATQNGNDENQTEDDTEQQQVTVAVTTPLADDNQQQEISQTDDGKLPALDGSPGTTAEASPPPDIGRAVVAISQKVVTSILDNILAIVTRTWVLVLNFLIMLFVMFYMFQDSTALISYLRRISPLGDAEQTLVINRIRDVARAVLVGILGTALVQSAVAMILFKIVGIPALFWGSLLGMCSLIPFVGTALVWIPAVGYLFLTGHPGQAIFLAIGCGGIVANIDNILRPLFISGGRTGMSYLVLFFSILGGLQAFGLVGVIYGPLISGLCALCLLIFSTQFKSNNKTTTTTTIVE